MGERCSVDGCEREAITRGWCEMHYRRVLKTGDPGPPGRLRVRGQCSIDGCDRPVDAKGLCHGHYQRMNRGQELDAHPLRGSLDECLLDDCDRPVAARGYCQTHNHRIQIRGHPAVDEPINTPEGVGYVQHGYFYVPVPAGDRHLTKGSTPVAEHRLVMARHLGRALEGDENVHHINGDRLDNRIENLELWSVSQPSGQRVIDLLEYAYTLLARYEDERGFIRTD